MRKVQKQISKKYIILFGAVTVSIFIIFSLLVFVFLRHTSFHRVPPWPEGTWLHTSYQTEIAFYECLNEYNPDDTPGYIVENNIKRELTLVSLAPNTTGCMLLYTINGGVHSTEVFFRGSYRYDEDGKLILYNDEVTYTFTKISDDCVIDLN